MPHFYFIPSNLCFADIMNQLSQLRKALALINDQGLTTGLFIPVSATLVIAYTSISEAQIPVVVIALQVVKTIVLVLTPKMHQSATATIDFSTRGPPPSPSPTNRGQGDSLYTPVKQVLPSELAWRRVESKFSYSFLMASYYFSLRTT